MPEFRNPTPEQQIVVLVDADLLRRAEQVVESCENCNPDAAFPFDAVLDWLTRSDPSVTDYILELPAKCPNCGREVFEKTLVHPESAQIFSALE